MRLAFGQRIQSTEERGCLVMGEKEPNPKTIRVDGDKFGARHAMTGWRRGKCTSHQLAYNRSDRLITYLS
jgi:hypothetical protein